MTSAEPEVVNFEPDNALVSGADGLGAIREIFNGLDRFLKKDGLFALETGIGQQAALDELSHTLGFQGTQLGDLSGRPRFYFARRK